MLLLVRKDVQNYENKTQVVIVSNNESKGVEVRVVDGCVACLPFILEAGVQSQFLLVVWNHDQKITPNLNRMFLLNKVYS